MEAREKGSHPSGWVRVVVVKMSPIKKRDKRREESVRGRSRLEEEAGYRVGRGGGSLVSNPDRAPRGQGSMKCGRRLEETGTEQPQSLYPSHVSLLPTYTVVRGTQCSCLPSGLCFFCVPPSQDTPLFSMNSYSSYRA